MGMVKWRLSGKCGVSRIVYRPKTEGLFQMRLKYIVTHGIRIAKDFVPETFGRLTTIGPAFLLPVGKKGRVCAFAVCSCTCSEQAVSRVDDLRNGRILSCGCLKVEATRARNTAHGLSHSSEHRIWLGINQRCYNPKTAQYKDYGGRGIGLFYMWLSTYGSRGQGFSNFIEHIGDRPSPKHTIDRYPNPDGNYEPGNVRWATRTEQNNNRRNNHRVVYLGQEKTVAEWAIEVGIPANNLYRRIYAGWELDKVFNTPVKKQKPSQQK